MNVSASLYNIESVKGFFYPFFSNETEDLKNPIYNSSFIGGCNDTFSPSVEFFPIQLVIPMTVLYTIILVTGVIGNICTCIVISRNKWMHTATNYYLFSLAVSDLLLLVSGLPPEIYRLWVPEKYIFGQFFCILQGFAAESTTNATILTITAFTAERYLAICHPFLSHTMSKLSRAVRLILSIWIIALCLAIPQASQFGVESVNFRDGSTGTHCMLVSSAFEHAFVISTFVFFVGPMILITVLYVLIALRLRASRGTALMVKRASISGAGGNGEVARAKAAAAQNRVVKMLENNQIAADVSPKIAEEPMKKNEVAVVVAFFICWAPFHAQRLLAVFLANSSQEAQEEKTTVAIYMVLMYSSGILYFLSTTINPLLYNIMSNKFRQAFRQTLTDICRPQNNTIGPSYYSTLSRYQSSGRKFQRSISDGGTMINLKKRPNRQDSLCINVHQENTITDTEFQIDIPLHGPGPQQDIPDDNQDSDRSKKSHLRTRFSGKICSCFSGGTFAKAGTNFSRKFGQMYHGPIKMRKSRKFERRRQTSEGNIRTISNSSLQDLEDSECISTDLVKYMEEINEKINENFA